MYILNTKVLDRDYTNLSVPIKKLVPISHYGFNEQFYGGRVSHIGEIKDSKILLLIDNETDGIQVVDIAVMELESLNFDILKQYAKQKNMKFDWKLVTKEEILKLIKSKIINAA